MSLKNLYSNVLQPFIKKFDEAGNEKARKTVLNKAAAAVRESQALMEDADPLPKELLTAVRRYLNGCLKKDSQPASEPNPDAPKPKRTGQAERKPKKLKQVYTIRDVIKQHYRERVEEEIPYKSTDKEYLGSYQRAVTAVLQNMTEEELEDAQNMVEEWNKEGAPADVQVKRARTKLPKEVRKKVEEWKFSSGAVVLCLVSYRDGGDVRSFHIETTPTSGSSFTNSCPSWKEGTYEAFTEWSLKHFGVNDKDSDDDEEVPLQLQKARDITFETNDIGDFILPPWNSFRIVRERQRVVRGYIGALYRKFTKNKIAAFPYGLAAKDDQTIYDPDSVPEGFVLSDPDHLNGGKITALYEHWRDRQRRKLPGFVILRAGSNQHVSYGPYGMSEKAMGKKKMPWVDVSDENEDEGDDENDPEEDRSDEDELPPVKLGPPVGKRAGPSRYRSEELEPTPTPRPKNKLMKNQRDTDRQRGPDKRISPVKKGLRGDTQDDAPGEGVKTQKLTKMGKSQKRKLDDDAEPRPTKMLKRALDNDAEPRPTKSLKRARAGGEPGAVVEGMTTGRGQKRKAAVGDDDSPSAKRIQVDASQPPPKRSGKARAQGSPPATDPPKQPGSPEKVRVSGRVKEYPQGNAATSTSRMAFLRSLCKVPKFGLMVDLIPAMPKPSAIPKNYPPWVTWSSKEVYLPPDFHSSSKAFNKALSILKESLTDSSVFEERTIDAPLLLLGLISRDVSRAMEIEPEEESVHPQHLVDSALGIKELRKLQDLIESVSLP